MFSCSYIPSKYSNSDIKMSWYRLFRVLRRSKKSSKDDECDLLLEVSIPWALKAGKHSHDDVGCWCNSTIEQIVERRENFCKRYREHAGLSGHSEDDTEEHVEWVLTHVSKYMLPPSELM